MSGALPVCAMARTLSPLSMARLSVSPSFQGSNASSKAT